MFGRLTLQRRRTIILERASAHGAPFKSFSAIYADSGISVPELDGANAGNKLIGVGPEVFSKTLMCQGSVMALSENAELERRIFALSGGGDEESSALEAEARLSAWARERNFNGRTGLMPRLTAEISEFNRSIEAAEALNKEEIKLRVRISELERKRDEAERLCGAFGRRTALQRQERVSDAIKAANDAKAEFEGYCEKETIFDGRADREKVLRARERFDRVSLAASEAKAAEAVVAAEAARFQNAPAKRNRKPLFVTLFFFAVALVLGIALPSIVFYAIAGGFLLFSAGLFIFTRRRKAPDAGVRLESAQASLHLRANASKISVRSRIAALAWRNDSDGLDCFPKRCVCRQLKHAACLPQRGRCSKRVGPENASVSRFGRRKTAIRRQSEGRQNRSCRRFYVSSKWHAELSRLEGRIATGKNITELAAALDVAKRALAAAEFEFAAINIAREALAQSAEELSRRLTPSLNARAAELFTNLTGKRYDRLTVGRGFDTMVSPAGGALVSPAYLSSGAYDLLYLSLRLRFRAGF